MHLEDEQSRLVFSNLKTEIKAGITVQVVKCLPSKLEALSSNLITWGSGRYYMNKISSPRSFPELEETLASTYYFHNTKHLSSVGLPDYQYIKLSKFKDFYSCVHSAIKF
jgi:hypothetical protein